MAPGDLGLDKSDAIIKGDDEINVEQYKIMLKNVYAANRTSPKELELLQAVRTSLNITEEMHKKLEAQVRAELNQSADSPAQVMPDTGFNVIIQEQPEKPSNGTKFVKKVKIKKYFTLGKEKYRCHDFENALKFFTKCHELAPENEEFEFLVKKSKLKLKIAKSKERAVESPEQYTPAEEITVEADLSSSTRVAIPLENPYREAQNPSSTPEKPQKPAPAAIPVENTSAAVETEPENGSNTCDDEEKCISCDGSGKCYWCSGSGNCDRCEGSGEFNDSSCAMCNGTGNCNSCNGEGTCMWCQGTGKSIKRRNNIYTPT